MSFILITIYALPLFSLFSCTHPKAMDITSLFFNSTLLCDLQILHDGIQFFTLASDQVPVKIVYPPNYSARIQSRSDYQKVQLPSINTLKSRLPPCKLTFLVSSLSTGPTQENISLPVSPILSHWFKITSEYHLFYQSYFPYRKKHLTFTNTLVVLIYTRKREHFSQDVGSHIFYGDHKFVRLSVIFVTQKNYNLCHILIKKWERFQIQNCLFTDHHVKENPLHFLFKGPKSIKLCCELPFGEEVNPNYPRLPTNPFDRRVNYSITRFVQTIASKTNASIHWENGTGYCQAQEKLKINPQLDDLYWESVLIVSKINGYTYLSCYSDNYVSFKFYLAPFQPATWLSLIISLFVVISVLSMSTNWRPDRFSTPAWLYASGTLFAQCYVPLWKIEIPYFRILFNIWCLMLVILSNGYTGLITTELNSPFPTSHPEVWEDLVCKKLPSPEDNSTSAYHIGNQFGTYVEKLIRVTQTREKLLMSEPDNCFHLLSLPKEYNTGYPAWPMFVYFLIDQCFRMEKRFTNSYMDRQLLRSLNLLMPQNYHHTRDFDYGTKYNDSTELQKSVEKEVVDCRRKSVFISHEHLVDEEYRLLSKYYAGKKFYKGRDVLASGSLFNGLAFPLVGKGSRLVRYFSYLVNTGIYGRIEQELGERRMLFKTAAVTLSKVNDRVVPLSLDGTIVTVFVLSGWLIILAGVVFMVENNARIGKFFGYNLGVIPRILW
ncbi:hypothetical protein Fcan01_23178 [Folsomia candida]|uniref:Uncharacterized protein n=1 Tax=Folsomia candida TaxID=158441 RepID=A0A226DBL6_FOLCA|nr:hypothetical protein Fcan01_23178 [Folsomia candida]